MIRIEDFVQDFGKFFRDSKNILPWEFTGNLLEILHSIILQLNGDFDIEDNVAIHKSARIESGVTLKGPVIVSENCFIGAHAYFRGGAFLGKGVTVGPGCEIKTSVIMPHSAIAHFNFIGDSIIGSNVNFEAGAITANHYNERTEKQIQVAYNSIILNTNTVKFGSLVGDNSKIGASAVLSPGTILPKNSIVKRLELVEQVKSGTS